MNNNNEIKQITEKDLYRQLEHSGIARHTNEAQDFMSFAKGKNWVEKTPLDQLEEFRRHNNGFIGYAGNDTIIPLFYLAEKLIKELQDKIEGI